MQHIAHLIPGNHRAGRLGTRFVALDTKPTYLPPALIVASNFLHSLGCHHRRGNHVLEGEQLAAWPRQSRRSICRYQLRVKMPKPRRAHGVTIPHPRNCGPSVQSQRTRVQPDEAPAQYRLVKTLVPGSHP